MTAVDLDNIRLSYGSHESRADGMCLMEAVAYVAGEPHTDHPQCVCPVLAAFGRSWNDALDDEDRNRLLRPFIPRLVGTRSTVEVEQRRAFMAADWAVRVATPVWLRAGGLVDEAGSLEALPPLTSAEACIKAMPTLRQARAAAAAAGDAARVAAGDAAGAAVTDAARDAARAAGLAAATDAAWDAADAADGTADVLVAGAVAVDAAVLVARAAATAAAVAASTGAVTGAARVAAGDAAVIVAGDVAGDAARTVLRPHVAQLQASAVDLYEQMIEVVA